MSLRYGENPHQQGALYKLSDKGIGGAEQLHGKELSFNNLVDLDAAWQLTEEFDNPAAVIIKHTNPCGCAEQESLGRSVPESTRGRSHLRFWRRACIQQARWMRKLRARSANCLSKRSPRLISPPKRLKILTAKKNLRLVKVKPSTRQSW